MNSRSYSHNQINRYIVLVHIQYSYLWEKSEIDIECDRDLFFLYDYVFFESTY